MLNTKIYLIVDSIDDNCIELQEALIANKIKIIATVNVKNTEELITHYRSVSALVCQFRTVKASYLDTISQLMQENPKPIILFTNDDSSDAIEKSVKIGVNAYIVDGFNSERIKAIVEVAISRFKSYQKIVTELKKTRQQLENRKLIDKAKGILMKSKNIDEQEAYRAIRKMAMDKGKSMADIAQSIIDVMEIML